MRISDWSSDVCSSDLTHGSNATEHPTRTTGTGTTRASDQQGDPTSMSSVRLEAVKNTTTKDIPMQPASADIWDKKYRLKTKAGAAVDADIDGTYQRVAKALSEAEPDADKRKYWNEGSEEHTTELPSLMHTKHD